MVKLACLTPVYLARVIDAAVLSAQLGVFVKAERRARLASLGAGRLDRLRHDRYTIHEIVPSCAAGSLLGGVWAPFWEGRMDDGHGGSVRVARYLYDSVKLMGESLDDARAETGLGLLRAEIRLAGAGVGDR